MKKKEDEPLGVVFNGKVTINGPMFDIHDNSHVHITRYGNEVQQEDVDFEFVNLVFFDKDMFGTYERQIALRKLLKEAFKRMMLDTGRDLISVYIAYHFLKDQLLNMKGYTDFLQDIEGLMPGLLPKIKVDETNRSLRYKSYAESLAWNAISGLSITAVYRIKQFGSHLSSSIMWTMNASREYSL